MGLGGGQNQDCSRPPGGLSESETLDAAFSELVHETVNHLFEKHPITATFMGVHEYDGELGDFSREFVSEEAVWAKTVIRRLEEIDPSLLSHDHQVDRSILLGILRDQVLQAEVVRHHEIDPGMYLTYPMMGCYVLAIREFAPLESRVQSIISRLRQIPKVLQQGMENVECGARVFVETALSSANAGLLFYQSLIPALASKVQSSESELTEAGQAAMEKTKEFIRFLERILPRSSEEFAVGEDVFNQMLSNLHMVDWDAEYLEVRGRELFDMTLQQLEQAAREIDSSQSWEDILEDLKGDHPSAEELVDHYSEQVKRVKDFVLSYDLVDVPDGEDLVVEPTPPFQRATIPYAAYVSPAPFESEQVGRFWVTAPSPNDPDDVREACLRGHCRFAIPTTCGHETYPGHHLQRVWSNRNESLVRKLSRSTLFIEGWAFYTEELLESTGYLADPRTRLVRLSDQLWRAARILLDVWLHTGEMSLDEAVDFLVKHVHRERSAAIAEVRRYAGSPTQPMSYLMGKMEILKLLDNYRAQEGETFTLKRFHGDLLRHGSIPPAAVRQLIIGK